MLQSDLCHYSDAYIAVNRNITVADPNYAACKKISF